MEELPQLYSVLRGEVASVQSYGAFVKLEGFKKHGLVHKSQISREQRVEDVTEVLSTGDRVWCKVISLGEEGDRKISLSMKVINQDTGKDLDPNLVQTKQEEQRRKRGGYIPKPKIELGAVLNTVCKKCGTKGHLSQDCFYQPGDKTYDLIPDIDPSVPSEKTVKSSTHRKRQKHKKKKKKRPTSDDSDEEYEREKRKKQKKKKRRKTASSSGSDSVGSHSNRRRSALIKSKHSDENKCRDNRDGARHPDKKKPRRSSDYRDSGSESDSSRQRRRENKRSRGRHSDQGKGRRKSSTDSRHDRGRSGETINQRNQEDASRRERRRKHSK